MIDKIKRTLIIKYTLIIEAILLSGFMASYLTYRHNLVRFLEENLTDYLADEVWEAKDYVITQKSAPTIHLINNNNKIIHNFTYWFFDKHLTYAEVPEDQVLAGRLLTRLSEEPWDELKTYHLKLRGEKKKSHFLMMKKDLHLRDGRLLEVFALSNYKPIIKSFRRYAHIAVYVIAASLILAYLLGNLLAARSMKYIKTSYEKQKQFVSNATHELRTPLSILLSYAELLEYKAQDHELQQNIKDEILHMNDLIENLLCLARYDNNTISLHTKKFDLISEARKAINHISELSPNATIKLEDSSNINIYADQGMIYQLLYILLDNAIKYTPKKKKIIVKISSDSHNAQIVVSDNGSGIASQDLKHIFDRFWRGDKSRHQKGLGLGLSLASEIVKLHKGKITVESSSKGSDFIITLPLE